MNLYFEPRLGDDGNWVPGFDVYANLDHYDCMAWEFELEGFTPTYVWSHWHSMVATIEGNKVIGVAKEVNPYNHETPSKLRIPNQSLTQFGQTNIEYVTKLCSVFLYGQDASMPPEVFLNNGKLGVLTRRQKDISEWYEGFTDYIDMYDYFGINPADIEEEEVPEEIIDDLIGSGDLVEPSILDIKKGMKPKPSTKVIPTLTQKPRVIPGNYRYTKVPKEK